MDGEDGQDKVQQGGAQAIRQAIFEADDRMEEIVEVPQWGVKVKVRGLTGHERGNMLEKLRDDEDRIDLVKVYPELIIRTALDPNSDEPIFTPSDHEALLGRSAGALEVLARKALLLSGLDDKALERAGKVSSEASAASS